MRLYLVHHAEAVSPDVDPQQPLSTVGHAQAARLAARAREAHWAPAAIWHSGKLRARQTAEALLRVNPFAEFQMIRGLRPDDPPEIVATALLGEPRDVMLVGHLPHLRALAVLFGPAVEPPALHGAVLWEKGEAGWAIGARLSADPDRAAPTRRGEP